MGMRRQSETRCPEATRMVKGLCSAFWRMRNIHSIGYPWDMYGLFNANIRRGNTSYTSFQPSLLLLQLMYHGPELTNLCVLPNPLLLKLLQLLLHGERIG